MKIFEMKMFEIRRLEIVINKYVNEKIETTQELIPISQENFEKIILGVLDWREYVAEYLKHILKTSIAVTEVGLKYVEKDTNNICCVYLLSLTKKYI